MYSCLSTIGVIREWDSCSMNTIRDWWHWWHLIKIQRPLHQFVSGPPAMISWNVYSDHFGTSSSLSKLDLLCCVWNIFDWNILSIDDKKYIKSSGRMCLWHTKHTSLLHTTMDSIFTRGVDSILHFSRSKKEHKRSIPRLSLSFSPIRSRSSSRSTSIISNLTLEGVYLMKLTWIVRN